MTAELHDYTRMSKKRRVSTRRNFIQNYSKSS